MCTREIVEVRHEGVYARFHVKGFEHVVAHKVREIAYGLQRNGLVEEVHGLLVVYAEPAAIPGPVLRKGGEVLNAVCSQALAQGVDVLAKARKVVRYGELFFCHDIEALRLGGVVLHPEDLGQGDGLAEARVHKLPKDHGILALVAQ